MQKKWYGYVALCAGTTAFAQDLTVRDGITTISQGDSWSSVFVGGGATLTMNGGDIATNFVVAEGGQATINGGTVHELLWGTHGTRLQIHGGSFHDFVIDQGLTLTAPVVGADFSGEVFFTVSNSAKFSMTDVSIGGDLVIQSGGEITLANSSIGGDVYLTQGGSIVIEGTEFSLPNGVLDFGDATDLVIAEQDGQTHPWMMIEDNLFTDRFDQLPDISPNIVVREGSVRTLFVDSLRDLTVKQKNGEPLQLSIFVIYNDIDGSEVTFQEWTGSITLRLVEPEEPACTADFNEDGSRTVQDLLAYLSAFRARDARADLDGNAGITVQDLLSFLSAFRAGCPA